MCVNWIRRLSQLSLPSVRQSNPVHSFSRPHKLNDACSLKLVLSNRRPSLYSACNRDIWLSVRRCDSKRSLTLRFLSSYAWMVSICFCLTLSSSLLRSSHTLCSSSYNGKSQRKNSLTNHPKPTAPAKTNTTISTSRNMTDKPKTRPPPTPNSAKKRQSFGLSSICPARSTFFDCPLCFVECGFQAHLTFSSHLDCQNGQSFLWEVFPGSA